MGRQRTPGKAPAPLRGEIDPILSPIAAPFARRVRMFRLQIEAAGWVTITSLRH